jgi:hypothetical protein
MLLGSFVALSLAVVIGGFMLAGKLSRLAILHGAAGATGLLLLILSWRHAALRGPFAMDALVLAAAALCGGLVVATLNYLGRPAPGLLLLLHGAAGGLAYLLLAGFIFG